MRSISRTEVFREVFRKGISAGCSGSISSGISGGWMPEKQNLAKVVHLVRLGTLFGAGAPNPDLGHSQIRV